MRAFVYILGASPNPNKIECRVPFKIDENEIFFGPCKKRLRQKLKREIDTKGKLKTETFFIGLNASNVKKERKIVWAGKIQNHYTFQQANEKLVGSKYLPIKTGEYCPLHVKQTKNGYQLISKLHSENNNWVMDLVSDRNSTILPKKKNVNSVTLKKGYTFDRDICFIFSNIFYANRFGKGIEINNEILTIFKNNQPDKKNIDLYAIFGCKKNHTAEGRTGGWLELKSESTQEIIRLIKKQTVQIQKEKNSSKTGTIKEVKEKYQGGCR